MLIFMMLCSVLSHGLCRLAETGTMSRCLSLSPSSGLCYAVTPVLRHAVFCHAVLRHAVFRRAMPRHAMPWLLSGSALAGFIGTFDGPLSFSDSSDSSEFRPRVMPCHAIFPALCSDSRLWDV